MTARRIGVREKQALSHEFLMRSLLAVASGRMPVRRRNEKAVLLEIRDLRGRRGQSSGTGQRRNVAIPENHPVVALMSGDDEG